ncbi:MAG: hypothetical protein ACI4SI_08970 [Candidatus Ornithospirochaeta sp.]
MMKPEEENKDKNSEVWTDIVAVVQVILIFLKLLGLIEWSWWIVLAPILVMVGILLIVIILATIV